MNITDEVIDAFYAGSRSEAYPLAVNDVVLVKKGRKSGALAAVISVQSPTPSVSYLVEYGDGSDEIIPLAELERTEPNKASEPTAIIPPPSATPPAPLAHLSSEDIRR